MDKIEHTLVKPLAHVPVDSLSLRLERATIKMRHDPKWRIDKVNPTHDLVVALSGQGLYQIGEDRTEISLEPGEALLIPAYTRFRGRHGGGGVLFTGIAQHFTLDLFGRGDIVAQMALSPKVRLPDWPVLEPLIRHYRQSVPAGSTTLAQHHQFMVILLAYLDAAFRGWKTEEDDTHTQDHLSMHIMLVAARLTADPLGTGDGLAQDQVPYNADYFRRAFRDRMGLTPKQFRQLKRMEFAANRLGQGLSVKAVALELGYTDPYFFSRMFKRHLGTSPSAYRERPPK